VVLVGIGLNVRQSEDDLPPASTSLAASGVDVADRGALAVDLLSAIDRRYAALLAGESLVPPWAARLDTIGRDVVATGPAEVVRGRAVAVTTEGALVIETESGDRVTVVAGDVTMSAVGA
jgi:BirA family biotin operon repressor/biotin-[acetyl-CoA-carboxylase] ligase